MANGTDKEQVRPERTELLFRNVMAFVLVALLLTVLWCGKDYVHRPAPKTIVVYAFSTMEEALHDGVFPAFRKRWLAETGDQVELVATFAGSGAITDKILQRVPAEIAVLSSQLDALRLIKTGAVSASAWKELPHGGVLTRSPFVIVVREGNPLGIGELADLARPGTAIVHADPTTSGAALWSILAEYGSALRVTGDPDRAYAQLLGIWKNVTVRTASARAARAEFESGVADAFVTYEQDAIATPARAAVAGQILYPTSTVLSEQTAVKLENNVTVRQRALVDAFFEFLWSREAQQIFVEYGFRSPIEELNRDNPKLGAVAEPFTLDQLGGARTVEREILRAVFRDRVLSELEK